MSTVPILTDPSVNRFPFASVGVAGNGRWDFQAFLIATSAVIRTGGVVPSREILVERDDGLDAFVEMGQMGYMFTYFVAVSENFLSLPVLTKQNI